MTDYETVFPVAKAVAARRPALRKEDGAVGPYARTKPRAGEDTDPWLAVVPHHDAPSKRLAAYKPVLHHARGKVSASHEHLCQLDRHVYDWARTFAPYVLERHEHFHEWFSPTSSIDPAQMFIVLDLQDEKPSASRWRSFVRASTYLALQPGVMAAKMDPLEDARREVVEKPDDDEARLRFAKAARESGQHERADLIEAQLRIAKKEREPGDPTRVRSLLATHGPDWAREDLGPELVNHVRGAWRRGFLEWIEMAGGKLVQHADGLFTSTPVRGLRVTSLDSTSIEQLLSLPQLGGLRALSLRRLGLGDADAKALARVEKLASLRWLDLSENEIGDEGVRALIDSPHLREVAWIVLRRNPSRLPPRPGGREGDLILDTSWSEELLERDDLPEWLHRNAEAEHPRWFEV